MRKLALLVAAALVVSAPMLTTTSTESFAAAKAKKKTGATTEGSGSFLQAFSDQMSGINSGGTAAKQTRRSARKKKAQ